MPDAEERWWSDGGRVGGSLYFRKRGPTDSTVPPGRRCGHGLSGPGAGARPWWCRLLNPAETAGPAVSGKWGARHEDGPRGPRHRLPPYWAWKRLLPLAQWHACSSWCISGPGTGVALGHFSLRAVPLVESTACDARAAPGAAVSTARGPHQPANPGGPTRNRSFQKMCWRAKSESPIRTDGARDDARRKATRGCPPFTTDSRGRGVQSVNQNLLKYIKSGRKLKSIMNQFGVR